MLVCAGVESGSLGLQPPKFLTPYPATSLATRQSRNDGGHQGEHVT